MRFIDVLPDAWYADSLDRLTALGAIDGYDDGTFRPDNPMSVAEFLKTALAAWGYQEPVDQNPWYAAYVRRAKALGWVLDSDRFDYSAGLKRKEAALLMGRILQLIPRQQTFPAFSDVSAGDRPWIETAFVEHLLRGYYVGGVRTFRPDQVVTRAEGVTVIARMLEYRDNPDGYKAARAPALVPGDRFLEDGIRVFVATDDVLLAVGPEGTELLRSADSGGTWQQIYTFNKRVTTLHRTPRGILLAGISNTEWQKASDTELLRSTDDGRTFSRVLRLKSGHLYHWNIASDPTGYIFVSEYGYTTPPETARRIYRSKDHGRTWKVVYEGMAVESYHNHRILIDSKNPRNVYQSVGDLPYTKIIHSTDRGSTWKLLAGGYDPTSAIQLDDEILWGLDAKPISGIIRHKKATGKIEFAFRTPQPYDGPAYDMLYADGVLYAGFLSYGENDWPGSLFISQDQGVTWELWGSWPKFPGWGIGFYKFTRQGRYGFIAVELPVEEGGEIIPFSGTVRFPLLSP